LRGGADDSILFCGILKKNDTVTYLALPTVVSLTGLHFFPEGTTRKKSVGVEIPSSPNGTTKDVAEKFG
jgi:hypothetical protein